MAVVTAYIAYQLVTQALLF